MVTTRSSNKRSISNKDGGGKDGENFRPPAKKAKCLVQQEKKKVEDLRAESSFANLPTEILLRIFESLPLRDILRGISGVSRRFRTVGFDSITEIDLGGLAGLEDDKLWGPEKLSVSQVERLIGLCPRLVCLTLFSTESDRKASSVALATHALRNCPMLETLGNVDCNYNRTPGLFRTISERGLSLKSIDISNAYLSSGRLSNLTHIYLTNCDIDELAMRRIGENCRGLESFGISYERCREEMKHSEEGISILLQLVQGSIKWLSVSQYLMNEDAYANLAKCQLLEDVNIRNPQGLPLFGLKCILKLQRLRELSLYCPWHSPLSMKDEDIASAFSGKKLEALKRIYMTAVYSVGDATLCAIAQSCPRLQGLHVMALARPCGLVTDVGVRNIVQNCGKLRDLVLEYCPNVTEDAFLDYKEHLPKLRNLRLGNSPKISEDYKKNLPRDDRIF